MNKTVTFLLLALVMTVVFAQIVFAQAVPAQTAPATITDTADAVEDVPEVRRYTTEIIIFAYDQNVSGGSEIFVPDVPPQDMQSDDVSLDDEPLQSLPEFIEEPQPEIVEAEEASKYEIVMLAEDEFQLVDIYERLNRLDAYKPLLHFGWTQPTYPQDETQARPLSSFVTPPDGLAGELTLYLSRFLHLAVDLQLDAPETARAVRTSDAPRYALSDYDTGGSGAYSDEPEPYYPVRYRIEEDRIFRNGELRYFDHPKFGVLAKITRVEEAEVETPEEELTVEGELLGE